MIAEYKSKANLGIALGFVLAVGPAVYLAVSSSGADGAEADSSMVMGAVGLRILGVGLFIWGCSMYAKAKGRGAAYGLLGFLGIIGLIVLALMKDQSVAEQGFGFPVQPLGYGPQGPAPAGAPPVPGLPAESYGGEPRPPGRPVF